QRCPVRAPALSLGWPAALGAHGPAPAAHDGGAAAASPRCTTGCVPARPAFAPRQGRPRTVPRLAGAVASGESGHASRRLLVGARAGDVALAPPGPLPAGAAPSALA